MQIGFIFWLLMLLWLVLDIFAQWPSATPNPNAPRFLMGSRVLLYVLFFLLGWKAFGFMIQG